MPPPEFHDLEMYADAFEQEQIWREELERDQLENQEPAVMLEDWSPRPPMPAASIPSNLPF